MYTIKKVSILIPVFNEAGNLKILAKEISDTMCKTKYNYEVYFVNDGSSDNSWNEILQITCLFPNFRGIDLAGNYGQTIALRAGLNASAGDVIVAMDGDRQHNPAYIPRFLEYIEKGYDLVSGAKEKRPENRLKSFIANLAHKVICKISGVKMKYFGATFKAYRRFLFDNVNLIGDAHRFLGALVARKGTRYIELPIEIRKRVVGKSNYRFSKVFLVIVDLLLLKFSVSYISKPFRLFGIAGLILMAAGLLLLAYYVFGAFFFHWVIGKDYQIEFISSIFMVLFSLMLISIGIVAQIGTHNYFSNRNTEPYVTRERTQTFNYYEQATHN